MLTPDDQSSATTVTDSVQTSRRVVLRDTSAIATRCEAQAAVRLLIFPFTQAGLTAAGVQTTDTGAPKVPTAVVGENVQLRTSKGREGMAVMIASHLEASVSGSSLQSVSCKNITVLLKTPPIADEGGDANGWSLNFVFLELTLQQIDLQLCTLQTMHQYCCQRYPRQTYPPTFILTQQDTLRIWSS